MNDQNLANLLNNLGDIVQLSKSQKRGLSFFANNQIMELAQQAYSTLINEELEREINCFPGEPVFEPEWMAEDTQLHLERISNLTSDEEARALPEPVQVFWL